MSTRKRLGEYVRSIKRWAGRKYDEFGSRVYCDVVLGAYENAVMRVPSDSFVRSIGGFVVEGPTLAMTFLIGTSHKGLLMYSNGDILQLFPFPGFYGITRQGNTWYAFHKTGRHGRIISFRVEADLVTEARTKIWGLSRGVHQIDFIDGNLYVVDTYHNAVLRYDDPGRLCNVCWRQYSARFFPNGRLKHGRSSENYCHFNSIYKYGDTIYLVAHNETYKTGKSSEIFLLDEDFHLKEIRAVNGSNCHNFYKDGQLEIVGLSMEGAVQNNDKPVLVVGKFLRGVSVSEDYYIFGGSDIEPDRERRGQTRGMVYVTDLEFNILLAITLENTQIQEIRRVDKPDYTLSDVPKG